MVGFRTELGGFMTASNTLADPGARSAHEAHEPYSAAWWENRTAEELRDIIKRGFAGGQTFDRAVEETERRAREMAKRAREAAAAEAEALQKRKRIIILGTAAAAIATVAACAGMWFTR